MNLDNPIAVRSNKTIYRDEDKVIKLFDPDYSKSDVLNEALNQARVEETGLNLPKVVEVTKIGEKWGIIFEYVEGKTITQLIKENPEKIDDYLNIFVDLQMLVHSKKCPLLNKLKDKMNRKISQSPLDATARYDMHTRLESMPKHDKLCHGDFSFGNVVLSGDDNTPYVLDWAHATQGNASADVARSYLLFKLANNPIADKYLDLFCKKSDTAKQYIQKWLPIVASSQLVKGKPEEHDFLVRWVNVVEYE